MQLLNVILVLLKYLQWKLFFSFIAFTSQKIEVFYRQEPLVENLRSLTVRGVNYQLLAVMLMK